MSSKRLCCWPGRRPVLRGRELNELLYLHEVEGFVAADFDVSHLTDARLEAEVWGERMDRARHPLVGHVKAATYHLLHVRRSDGGWEAQVVVDV